MKSNFTIQAEIDIKNHPEWNYAEQAYCMFMAYIKEENIKKKFPEKKQPEFTKDNLDALINSVRATTYMPQPIPFIHYCAQDQRGLRSYRTFFDDAAIIGGIN